MKAVLISLSFNGRLFIIAKAKLVQQVPLAESLLSIDVASATLCLLILLLVGDQQLLNLRIDHLLALRLLLPLRLLVVHERSWLDTEVTAIILQLFQQGKVGVAGSTIGVGLDLSRGGSLSCFLHASHHGAELQNLGVRSHTTTHGKSHLHVIGLLLRLPHRTGRSLDQILQLLVAKFEGHAVSVIEVLVLHTLRAHSNGSIDQDLAGALLEEFHLGLSKVEHFIVIFLLAFRRLLCLLLLSIIFRFDIFLRH